METWRLGEGEAKSIGHRPQVAAPPAQKTNDSSPQAPSPKTQTPSKDDRRRQRRLAALEDEIAMLEAEMKQLAEEMTTASVQADGKRVKSLEMQYSDVQEMLNSRYDEWSAAAG